MMETDPSQGKDAVVKGATYFFDGLHNIEILLANIVDGSTFRDINSSHQKVYEVIIHSAGNSWAFEDRVPRMQEGEKGIQSTIDIFLKDLGIVLEKAKALNLVLPVSEATYQQYEFSHKSGLGKSDDSSIYKNYLKRLYNEFFR